MGSEKYTYSGSGVDVFRNDDFTDHIKNVIKVPDWVLKEPTGYATILNFTTPKIVLTADGIGSKLLLHIKYRRWSDAAQDLIAMNYNDIVCVGGKPRAFVDYLGVHHIDRQHYEFIEALVRKLDKYDMALVAGETAEIPSIYTENDWDVAGFCIGTLEKRIPIETIEYGDSIIGLPASGFHSNGWSLIRKIIESENISIEELSFDLLAGTKIYKEVTEVFELIKGIAHVTGGGILRALRRVLGDKGYEISITLKPYIEWILKYVEIPEAIKTFNMGYGMILVIAEKDVESVLKITNGEVIGKVSQNTNIVIQ